MGTLLGHLTLTLFIYSSGLCCAVMMSWALSQGRSSSSPHSPQRTSKARGVATSACGGSGEDGSRHTDFGRVLPAWNQHFLPIDWEDARRPFQHHNAWQHATIIAFFLLSALVDLTTQAWLTQQSMKLEWAATALALVVIVLEMVALIEHRNALEFRVHIMLMLPSFLLALVLTIKVWAPDQPPFWVLKAWLMLVSGSGLLVVTLLLHAPLFLQPWQADSIVDLAFVTTFFCWLLGLRVVILATVYGLCSLWHHCCSSWKRASGAEDQPCPLGEDSEELEQFRAEAVLQVKSSNLKTVLPSPAVLCLVPIKLCKGE